MNDNLKKQAEIKFPGPRPATQPASKNQQHQGLMGKMNHMIYLHGYFRSSQNCLEQELFTSDPFLPSLRSEFGWVSGHGSAAERDIKEQTQGYWREG